MVVAVHTLGGPTRIDHVDLRGHLIAGSQPGPAHGRDEVVRVVVREHLGRPQGQLLQRVPDPVVLPGGGEVVPGRAARGPLGGNDRLELPRGPVDDPRIIECARQQHDAGTVEQGTGQFGFNPRPARRAGKLLPQPCAVVDEHVLLDGTGVRVIGQIRLPAHQVDEVGQAAIFG